MPAELALHAIDERERSIELAQREEVAAANPSTDGDAAAEPDQTGAFGESRHQIVAVITLAMWVRRRTQARTPCIRAAIRPPGLRGSIGSGDHRPGTSRALP